MADYYGILGLPRNARLDEIKQAYIRRSLEWHPTQKFENREEADKKFKDISNAYQTLSDETKRRVYDRHSGPGSDEADSWLGDFSEIPSLAFRDPLEVYREFEAAHVALVKESQEKAAKEAKEAKSPKSPATATAPTSSAAEAPPSDNLVSTVTEVRNGTSIVMETVKEGGNEIVTVYEDGTLTSRTINGVTVDVVADQHKQQQQQK